MATPTSATPTPITVAHGDGIGPEIMGARLDILKAAGARLEIETIEVGEKVYLSGNTAGILPSAWASLRRTRVFLKAPVTTPQGGGYKSLNVTARKMLGLYANIRPCVSYHPFVVVALHDRVVGLGLEIAMTENLRNYDGKAGFTLAQGQ